jgi:2-(1,2-epoxy-1,2-dihydrophenyl)acetyl-CoA isomerase
MMRVAEDRLGEPEGATDVWRWIRHEFGGVVRLIARGDTAFVAALNGPAAGVGLAWPLACDVIVASEEAVLVPAFGRLGLLPEVGTSWTLTRRLGYQGAFAFFVGGRHLTAGEARDAGLVQEVVPHDELQAAAGRWCDNIAALPAHALAVAKPLLRAAADASWETALATEEFAEPNCFTTGSFQDAVRGMLEGRS